MVFEYYADYYDSLYQDKNYLEECNFVRRIFERYGTGEINTILDLGCGTGTHDLILSDMGYRVTGIDVSEKMLQIAVNKAGEQQKPVDFLSGDIRSIDLGQRFDAVLAMFNVLGYQTTNQDIESAMQTVRRHLAPGGLFICDVWFGPAVLQEKPDERTKSIERGDSRVVRHARPVLDIIRQTVEVNYTVSETAGERQAGEIEEHHLVRFFFYQELLDFLERNGINMLKICPFLELDGELDERCWNISVIGKGA